MRGSHSVNVDGGDSQGRERETEIKDSEKVRKERGRVQLTSTYALQVFPKMDGNIYLCTMYTTNSGVV